MNTTFGPCCLQLSMSSVFIGNEVQALCKLLNVKWKAVASKQRTQDLSNKRQLIISALRKMRPELSTIKIGNLFNRDHSTVIHCTNVARQALVDDLILRYRTAIQARQQAHFNQLQASLTDSQAA